ncbi:hypothetical protein H072_3020 [Dactylellina haptotyla CBS 200.50]|uniref:PHD-type domain-containing protein n=1 Tax=Dactylellina haptotyla (strain CBS 200.50) TaxID=1284197 RepID=S8C5N1_DACHA|nr:hypothetical protein H072_3020 [Dactylellina haptotyla CBS 200.50]
MAPSTAAANISPNSSYRTTTNAGTNISNAIVIDDDDDDIPPSHIEIHRPAHRRQSSRTVMPNILNSVDNEPPDAAVNPSIPPGDKTSSQQSEPKTGSNPVLPLNLANELEGGGEQHSQAALTTHDQSQVLEENGSLAQISDSSNTVDEEIAITARQFCDAQKKAYCIGCRKYSVYSSKMVDGALVYGCYLGLNAKACGNTVSTSKYVVMVKSATIGLEVMRRRDWVNQQVRKASKLQRERNLSKTLPRPNGARETVAENDETPSKPVESGTCQSIFRIFSRTPKATEPSPREQSTRESLNNDASLAESTTNHQSSGSDIVAELAGPEATELPAENGSNSIVELSASKESGTGRHETLPAETPAAATRTDSNHLAPASSALIFPQPLIPSYSHSLASTQAPPQSVPNTPNGEEHTNSFRNAEQQQTRPTLPSISTVQPTLPPISTVMSNVPMRRSADGSLHLLHPISRPNGFTSALRLSSDALTEMPSSSLHPRDVCMVCKREKAQIAGDIPLRCRKCKRICHRSCSQDLSNMSITTSDWKCTKCERREKDRARRSGTPQSTTSRAATTSIPPEPALGQLSGSTLKRKADALSPRAPVPQIPVFTPAATLEPPVDRLRSLPQPVDPNHEYSTLPIELPSLPEPPPKRRRTRSPSLGQNEEPRRPNISPVVERRIDPDCFVVDLTKMRDPRTITREPNLPATTNIVIPTARPQHLNSIMYLNQVIRNNTTGLQPPRRIDSEMMPNTINQGPMVNSGRNFDNLTLPAPPPAGLARPVREPSPEIPSSSSVGPPKIMEPDPFNIARNLDEATTTPDLSAKCEHLQVRVRSLEQRYREVVKERDALVAQNKGLNTHQESKKRYQNLTNTVNSLRRQNKELETFKAKGEKADEISFHLREAVRKHAELTVEVDRIRDFIAGIANISTEELERTTGKLEGQFQTAITRICENYKVVEEQRMQKYEEEYQGKLDDLQKRFEAMAAALVASQEEATELKAKLFSQMDSENKQLGLERRLEEMTTSHQNLSKVLDKVMDDCMRFEKAFIREKELNVQLEQILRREEDELPREASKTSKTTEVRDLKQQLEQRDQVLLQKEGAIFTLRMQVDRLEKDKVNLENEKANLEKEKAKSDGIKRLKDLRMKPNMLQPKSGTSDLSSGATPERTLSKKVVRHSPPNDSSIAMSPSNSQRCRTLERFCEKYRIDLPEDSTLRYECLLSLDSTVTIVNGSRDTMTETFDEPANVSEESELEERDEHPDSESETGPVVAELAEHELMEIETTNSESIELEPIEPQVVEPRPMEPRPTELEPVEDNEPEFDFKAVFNITEPSLPEPGLINAIGDSRSRHKPRTSHSRNTTTMETWKRLQGRKNSKSERERTKITGEVQVTYPDGSYCGPEDDGFEFEFSQPRRRGRMTFEEFTGLELDNFVPVIVGVGKKLAFKKAEKSRRTGGLSRHAVIYKVGRNVPGELRA